MVPPPPGEESQSVVLPPGWQSYLSPQGRRYYVNTTTNGESRSGWPAPAPGFCLSGGQAFSSLRRLLVFIFFRTYLRGSSPAVLGGGGLSLGGEACPSRLGSSSDPYSHSGVFAEPNLKLAWRKVVVSR